MPTAGSDAGIVKLCTSSCSTATHWQQTVMYAPRRLRLHAHGRGAGHASTLEGAVQLRAGLPGRPRGLQAQLEWRVRTRLLGTVGTEFVELAQNKTFSLFMFVGN